MQGHLLWWVLASLSTMLNASEKTVICDTVPQPNTGLLQPSNLLRPWSYTIQSRFLVYIIRQKNQSPWQCTILQVLLFISLAILVTRHYPDPQESSTPSLNLSLVPLVMERISPSLRNRNMVFQPTLPSSGDNVNKAWYATWYFAALDLSLHQPI